jgi:dihydrofolate synthase/folylpolyglutamate synthase
MTYPETIQFLYGLRLFGAKFGLENTFQLAALAGNPQARLRFIHVAGTNGKGSTCAMLESIYRAAGLRVGLFTSPHLVSFRERIQVNRQLISESEVVRLAGELQPLLPQFPTDHHPTFFEFVTVMALKFFAEQACELVIWETGLGGRLDATNIVTPLVSVITNIAFDHQQWLGDTLAAIAAEKAGIIKPGVPVLTTTDHPEALAVIEQIAREKNAPLTLVGAGRNLPQSTEVSAVLSRGTATLGLAGDHQKVNAALALATVGRLQPQLPVTAEAIRAGLTSVNWPGRLQRIEMPEGRVMVLDGAHNAAGARALRAALEKDFAGVRPLLIFGALADKKWLEICGILAPVAAMVFTVPVASERTAAAGDLAAAFRTANPPLEVVAAANLAAALSACQYEPYIVITGSLYLVGEALERLGWSPAGGGERGLNEWTTPKTWQ